jgi:hypothetical protein
MTVRYIFRVCFGLLLLSPALTRAEDARLPYHEIYRVQQAQTELSHSHTNLALELQMRPTEPGVKYSDIIASIDAKSGPIAVLIGPEGVFSVPMREDLLEEDPWIVVNQPRGTMELKWRAGLAPGLAHQMTNNAHYTPLMRAVRECDELQVSMRQFFPNSPRLTAIGLRLSFQSSTNAPQLIIHAKGGDRKVLQSREGELIIPLDGDLMDEDPVMTLTETPSAVEIVTRKYDAAP